MGWIWPMAKQRMETRPSRLEANLILSTLTNQIRMEISANYGIGRGNSTCKELKVR